MVCSITVHLIRHLPTPGNQNVNISVGQMNRFYQLCEPNSVMLPWKPEIVYGSDLLRCRESAALYFPEAIYKYD